MSSKRKIFITYIGFCLLSGLIFNNSFAINEGLLSSPQNQASGITLTQLPLNLMSSGTNYTISWQPNNQAGILWYNLNPGSGNPDNYLYNYVSFTPGSMTFDPDFLPVGFLYCMITSHDTSLTSIEFNLVRESSNAVTMISPQSDVNSNSGILTTTPTFYWQANPGVQYYHLLLSDQPFKIETDSITGEMSTTGANIIWQVITSGTSIAYGAPDPSGFFTNVNIPPLIGSLTGANRPTYNWVVLNNYGNTPSLTSAVVGELMAFEVAVAPPFNPPVLFLPDSGDIISSDNILFQWSSIPEASNYHLYLTKEEITPDSASIVYTPIWYVQSTLNAVECPAANLLTCANYRWKVIAEDTQGQGTMSVPADFYYSIQTASADFYIRSTGNQPVFGVQMEFIPLEGPNLPALLTDGDGHAERLMPFGTYILQLSKVGFVTTQIPPLEIEDTTAIIQNYNILEATSTAYGTVISSTNDPISFANLTATNVQTGAEENTQSNNNGYFAFDLYPGTWTFVASKMGYTSAAPKTTALLPEDNFDLNTLGGPFVLTINNYTLDGYVVNPDGEPIAIAQVTCTNGIETYNFTSGNNGYYSINVSQGTWILSAEKPAFWLSTTLPPIEVINTGFTNNIELTPAANIVSGIVFEGSALSAGNAIVRAIPDVGNIEETQVNDQGNFILSLASGNYQLNAYLNGFTSPAPITLSLSVGETISGVSIVLIQNNSYISGKVTYDGIQGVDSTIVSNGVVSTYTNFQGNYTLSVPAGPHTLIASKAGYITAVSPTVNVANGQTINNINLIIAPNAATISGIVLYNGQPVNLATVEARKVSTGAIYSVITQEDGNYSFGLSNGDYWLKASKTGYITSPESLLVNINPGQTIANVDFELSADVGYISGNTLYNGQGISYSQLTLEALDNSALTFNTQSNFYGAFDIAVTPQHSYIIIASKSGYVSAQDTSANVQSNTTQNFTLILTQLQSQLNGKVYALPDSTPLSNATVTAVMQGGGTYTDQTNTLGSYVLNLNAGSYNITASMPGYFPTEKDTSISAGQTINNYKFYLQPNLAVLQGYIKRASDQQPISNALISVTEINTQTGASVYSDATGFYIFDDLFQGSYNIIVIHPSYQTGQVNGVVLLGGATNTRNFSLSAANGSISGIVADNSEQPIVSATVFAERTAGGNYIATTGSTGTYTLSTLPSGTYNLNAAKEGYTIADTNNIALASGQQITGLNFSILPNNGIIVGRVVDEQGLGIGGAQISAGDSAGNYGNATTAGSGYYVLENLCVNSIYNINAAKAGYTNTSGILQKTARTTNPDSGNFIFSTNNLSISGTVRNQEGTPQPEIEVLAVSGGLILSDETNVNGEFIINGIAPQTNYQIQTNAYSQQFANASLNIFIGNTNITGIILTMQEHSSSISGLVTNVNGQGMANIEVNAYKTGTSTYAVYTNVNGSYTFENLYDGSYKVYVFELGYDATPDSHSVSLTVGQEITSKDFSLIPITIDISGSVHNLAGDAIVDSAVALWSTLATDTVHTDGNGNFIFEDITPGINYGISTLLNSNVCDNDYIEITAGYTNITNISLVVGVHNAKVSGWIKKMGDGGISGVTVNLAGGNNNQNLTLITSDSSFNFDNLYSGDYTMHLEKAGYNDEDTTFHLYASEQKEFGTIEMQSLMDAISGTIVDGFSGTPLQNVVVTVSDTANTIIFGRDTTGISGAYTVSGLDTLPPNNVYTINMVKKGFPDSTSSPIMVSTATQRNFTLMPLINSIYGTVRDESGNVKSNAIVRANKFGEAVYYDTTNIFGDYSFAPLGSGNYQLNSITPSLDSYFDNRYLPPSGRNILNETVLNTGKVYGTVTYNGHTPPGSATVTFYNTINQNVFTDQTTSNDSSYYFSGLRANLFSASASAPGFMALNSPRYLTPTLGDTIMVNFVLVAVVNAINGFALDSTSLQPIPSATIYLHKVDELDTIIAQSGNNGSYSFQNLADGNYEIWAEKNGYNITILASSTITVGNNIPVEQDLWLKSIPNSISGKVLNVLTSAGLSNALVHLSDVNGVYDSVLVTGNDGNFFFIQLNPGNYILTASKNNYTSQPVNYAINLQLDQSVFDKNFYLSAQVDSFDVEGYVSHGSIQVNNATVILRSLITGNKDTVFTNVQGHYIFPDWYSPDQLQLKVEKSGYPTLVSEAFDLDTCAVHKDFEYPAGQFKFFLTTDGETPLSNISVNVYNSNNNININLTTNNTGWAQTSDLLIGDNLNPIPYNITVTHFLPQVLPLLTYIDSLRHNEVITDTLIIGVSFTGTDTAQANEEVEIRAEVAEELVNAPNGFAISLFYKGVGKTAFEEIPMIQVITAPGSNGGGNNNSQNLRGSKGNNNGNVVILLEEEQNGSVNIPPLGVLTTNEIVTYKAVIPAQNATGIVQYYIHATTGERNYSNYNNKSQYVVESAGTLAQIQVQPNTYSLQLGLSKLFTVQSFDDALNPLNANLSTNNITWSQWDVENPTDSLGILTPIYSATLVDSAALSALFVATDSGTAKIKVQITQGAVTIAAIATVVVEYRVLDSLLVVADVTGNQVANTDSITFTINAYDVNQVPMNISPIWNVEPAGLGALIPLDQSKARFKPYPGTIGQIFITVFDSLSGISSSFNTLNLNPEEQGLFITQQITNSSDITVYDSAGFQLEIPPGCVDPGSSMEIILRRLPLPQVKKTSPSFEIHMNSYQLSADAQFSQNLLSGNISMMLTLPIPEETQRLQTSIGRWNETELEWEDLNGNVSPDGAYISAPINGFSEFVVLGESKHLGIENLEFHPDPFSPNTQKKLQIEFILNSLISETPIVSIKIYNMRGDLVRKVLEYESMPKGAHLYDNGVFQQGAVDGSVEWDGLTDAGLTARNGRYLVQVLVEDPSGKKEKFDTVVLIK